MHPTPFAPRDEIVSYQKLRNFIGITGLLLPVALVAGCYLAGDARNSWQHSISHYYYTKMHIVFVGMLCVLGGFLFSYKGKHKYESRVSNFAGLFAFGVAACPTSFTGFEPTINPHNQYVLLMPLVQPLWGSIHFVLAGLLFVCFILFCLVFFQLADEDYKHSEEIMKFKRRQKFYKICGWGIIVSIVLIGLFNFVLDNVSTSFPYTIFIFETTSLWFFGAAWLVKGSALWVNYPVLGTIIKPLR